jgi:hypothetical protein
MIIKDMWYKLGPETASGCKDQCNHAESQHMSETKLPATAEDYQPENGNSILDGCRFCYCKPARSTSTCTNDSGMNSITVESVKGSTVDCYTKTFWIKFLEQPIIFLRLHRFLQGRPMPEQNSATTTLVGPWQNSERSYTVVESRYTIRILFSWWRKYVILFKMYSATERWIFDKDQSQWKSRQQSFHPQRVLRQTHL